MSIRSNLAQQILIFGEFGLQVEAVSHWYSTPAYPAGAGADFVNGLASIRTKLGPQEVLSALAEMETRAGRERKGRWTARTVDLDLIDYNGFVHPDSQTEALWRELDPAQHGKVGPEDLILPHPRLRERSFVLYPLRDVAPEWRHPATGESVSELIAALPQAMRDEIRRLD